MLGFIPNLHVTTEGDHATAGGYVGLGKNLVQRLIGTTPTGGSAQQNHRINDNVEIRCKVVGDQRFVHIKAGGCTAYMDSGVVDLGSIAPANPLRDADGILHYSTALTALAAEGRLLGRIAPPKTKSDPPVNESSPPSFLVLPDAEGRRDTSKVAALYVKKLAAATVPASVFTGKMRLYVQSLYGANLARFSGFSINPVAVSAAPSLVYEQGDFTIVLSTNVGLYTSSDGKYFLVSLGLDGPDKVRVTKLSAAPCLDSLRAKALHPDTLDADRERIEAYVLSQSTPDPSISFVLDVPHQSAYAMGYGWHFNWSGTAADIIRTATVPASPGYKYSSTHYRLAFSRNDLVEDVEGGTKVENEQRRWSIAAEEVIEGPVEWKVNKWGEVIAYPEWTAPVLSIFGELLGSPFNADAPFYCFYRRDELQVVRATRSGGGVGTYYEIVSDPPYFWGGNYPLSTTPRTWQQCEDNTIGDEAAFSETRTFTSEPIDTLFSVNGAGARVRSASYSYSFIRDSAKTIAEVVEYQWFWDGFVPAGEQADFYIGRPQYGLNFAPAGCFVGYDDFFNAYDHVQVDGPCQKGQARTRVQFDSRSGGGSTSKSGSMLCVIPYYDSEAVYLWAQDLDVVTESGTTLLWDNIGLFDGWITHQMCTNSAQRFFRMDHIQAHPLNGWTSGPAFSKNNEVEYTTTYSQIHCGAGVFEFTPEISLSEFFAGESTGGFVTQLFSTHTSVSGSVEGNGIYLSDGYQTDLFKTKPAAFVGFA